MLPDTTINDTQNSFKFLLTRTLRILSIIPIGIIYYKMDLFHTPIPQALRKKVIEQAGIIIAKTADNVFIPQLFDDMEKEMVDGL
jgi:hypothetical protein